MKYKQALKSFKKKNICPFCNEKPQNMLEIHEHFYVIPARAPYVPHHLLIVPQRHVLLLWQLSQKEIKSLHQLVDKRTKKLHKIHKEVNRLLRDCVINNLVSPKGDKSVSHLHFHLIPDCPIGWEWPSNGPDRKFFEDKEYTKIAKDIKKLFI